VSVRTADEKKFLMRKRMEGMGPDEIALFEAIVEDARNGDTSLLEVAYEEKYVRRPVSMEQFIFDEAYLGKSMGSGVYPRLMDDLVELHADGQYHEVIWSGSIGYGKSTVATILFLKMLEELSCLRDPHATFGIASGSPIVLALVSKSIDLARKVLLSKVVACIEQSSYFSKAWKCVCRRDGVRCPSNIKIEISAASSERLLGMDVFGAIVDEMNFMATKHQLITTGGKKSLAHFDRAEKLYAGIVRRIKSRFASKATGFPGMVILISSANTIGSFLDRRLVLSKNDPNVFARDYAIWHAKPPGSFSEEMFRVMVGTDSLRSRVMEPGEAPSKEDLHDGAYILDVPMDFHHDFTVDLESSLRDIAGISTHAIRPFISRREKVDVCVDPNMRHPFTSATWTTGQPGTIVWDWLAVCTRVQLSGGHEELRWAPRVCPGAPRAIHIDIGLSGDSLGIAMGYVSHWVEVKRRTEELEEYTDVAPFVVIEFMLQIEPPTGDQIFLAEVRSHIVYEILVHGFPVSSFTMDSYQSADTLQQVKAKGVNRCEVLSVDKTSVPYDALKSALYENRIRFYRYETFIREVKALEFDAYTGKVDHPVAGSKDVSDAVAGVTHALIELHRRLPAPMVNTMTPEMESDAWVATTGIVVKSRDDIEAVLDAKRGRDMNKLFPFLMG